ncbi:hypothetical protein HY504_01005 [Candidatus Wolfebacteria bacterium]|nr:hypothetical protein [Candidatus Wolfebacteria bacterium]
MNQQFPPIVAPFLWSYDLSRLDLIRDKKRIITNILNYGTKEATDWLFTIYSREDLKDAIRHPLPGEWSKKSLNFWAIILDVSNAKPTARRIP